MPAKAEGPRHPGKPISPINPDANKSLTPFNKDQVPWGYDFVIPEGSVVRLGIRSREHYGDISLGRLQLGSDVIGTVARMSTDDATFTLGSRPTLDQYVDYDQTTTTQDYVDYERSLAQDFMHDKQYLLDVYNDQNRLGKPLTRAEIEQVRITIDFEHRFYAGGYASEEY